jgi:hypothetical protein
VALNTSGLRPAKPGDVRNPKGLNQYTYRADAEKHLDDWCKKYGKELIERLLEDAKSGKGYAMHLALDRILPAVQKHDVKVYDADPAELEAALDRFVSAEASEVLGHVNGNGSA